MLVGRKDVAATVAAAENLVPQAPPAPVTGGLAIEDLRTGGSPAVRSRTPLLHRPQMRTPAPRSRLSMSGEGNSILAAAAAAVTAAPPLPVVAPNTATMGLAQGLPPYSQGLAIPGALVCLYQHTSDFI